MSWNTRANEIFADAAEIENYAARKEFISERCGEDIDLRRQVEGLFDANANTDDFLSRGVLCDELTVELAKPRESPGTVIGNYKLLQRIGEGGFGIVYMAEQKRPVRRKVALKVIKAGMDTKEVIARFEAERQALAMMDHPYIAKVFGAGATESGRPYFVMELVRGVSITEFCDANSLRIDQRLQLYLQVCNAIQHAHQKAIIHRDIKPNNVLVTMHDDTPVPKVIDFGIAKCTQTELTQKTLFTQFGQLVGTPAYMSPEQAQLSGLDIDTRCDVYALGVLLYELLTGVTPFEQEELLQGGLDEICRRLREEEPPRPSHRLSTLQEESRVSMAKARGLESERHGSHLRGDLDWITMKAMEKNRSRRYESASALAADVCRYLASEPVEAAAPSTVYRLRKFLLRHKGSAITVVIVSLSLLVGSVLASWQAYRATKQRDRAEAAEVRALQNESLARSESERANANEQEARRLLYLSDMHAAQLAWEEGNVPKVLSFLGRHLPDESTTRANQRGFEWHYLYGLCSPRLAAKSIQMNAAPNDLDWALDSRSLLVADRRKGAAVFDRLTLKAQDSYSTAIDWLNFAKFSVDSSQVAVARYVDSRPALVLISRVDGGEQHLFVPSLPARMAFSPDGQLIATTLENGQTWIWNEETTRLPSPPKWKEDSHRGALAFSKDSRLLAIGSDSSLQIWDIEQEKLVQPSINLRGRVNALVFSCEDSSVLYGGTENGWLYHWNAERLQEISAPTQPHTDGIRSISISPRDNIVATGSRDNTIKLWTGELKPLRTIKGHSGMVDAIAISPDGQTLASASQDHSVVLWDMNELTEPIHVPLSQSSEELADVGGNVYRIEAGPRPSEVRTLSIPTPLKDKEFLPLATSARGDFAVKLNEAIEIWRDVIRIGLIPMAETRIATRFHPTESTLAIGKPNGTVLLWIAGEAKKVVKLPHIHRGGVREVTFSADGSRLACGGADGSVYIWDVASKTRIREFSQALEDEVWALEFCPNNHDKLLAGSLDGHVAFLDVCQQTSVRREFAHTGAVNDILFSADVRTVITAGGEGLIRIWDAERWEERGTLHGHEKFANRLEWHDDQTLISKGSHAIRVWRSNSISESNDFEQ